jgi:hypothetical protein
VTGRIVAKPRPISYDDIVKIDTRSSKTWRVLDVAEGLAHLTDLRAFPRVDTRNIPVERLKRVQS